MSTPCFKKTRSFFIFNICFFVLFYDMGTKKTLLCGKSYKVYHQCFDDENIYLDLSDVEIEKNETGHTIVIPIWIWDKINKVSSQIDLSLAKMNDHEIETKVKEEVDSRIRELSLFGFDDAMAKLIRVSDHIKFGSVQTNKDEQIKKGIAFYMQEKEKQKKVLEKIKENHD